MKKLIPAYILSFVISFMLFIYEPLLLYSTNVNDFWFDISLLFSHTFVVFFVVFLFLSLMYTGIYCLIKKIFKNVTLYNIVLVLSFSLFLIGYIQGNYLVGNLPVLDGTAISWNVYNTENIVALIAVVVVLIIQ